MPITNYSPAFDLFAIGRNIIPGTLINVADAGTGFDVNITGSDTATPPDNFANCQVSSYLLSAQVNHTTPINPVPADAKITKIDIQFHVDYLFTSNSSGGVSNTAAYHFEAYAYNITSGATFPLAWLTSSDLVPLDHGDSTPGNANAADSGGLTVRATYDFTLNPNGSFPLGYATRTTLINFFSVIHYFIYGATNAGNDGAIGRTASAVLSIVSANWAMDVYWQPSYSWTVIQNGPNLEINSPDLNPDLTTVDAIVIKYGNKKLTIPDPPTTPTKIIVPIPATCTPLGEAIISGIIAAVEYEINTIAIV